MDSMTAQCMLRTLSTEHAEQALCYTGIFLRPYLRPALHRTRARNSDRLTSLAMHKRTCHDSAVQGAALCRAHELCFITAQLRYRQQALQRLNAALVDD